MNKKLLYGCTFSLMLTALSPQAQTQINTDIKGNSGDHLGDAIALSDDGTVMALGYPSNKTYFSTFGQGKAKIFKNDNGTWTQIGSDIKGQTANVDLKVGTSIALSADGTIVAIGIPGSNGKNWEKDTSGAVQILKNNNGNWTEIGYILGENDKDSSGNAISLSADGNTIAIGATSNNGGGAGTAAGQVRVFQNINGTWTQIGSDIDGQHTNDAFGSSVAISADGTTVAASSPFNSENGSETGSVRVFKNINGDWTKIGTSLLGDADDYGFGKSVSLSGDGSIVAVGGWRYPQTGANRNAGHTRIFQNINNQYEPIGSDIMGASPADASGSSVSLSTDGTIVAIGSTGSTAGGIGTSTGQVRIFQNSNNDWVQRGTDINGKTSGEMAGTCVTLSGNGKVVASGAPLNSANGQFANNGMVRVYDISSILASDSFVLSNTSIYPNPAINNLYIDLQQALNLKAVNIYTVLGQLIKTESTNVIRVNDLEKGLYLVQVITDKGSATHKIMVN